MSLFLVSQPFSSFIFILIAALFIVKDDILNSRPTSTVSCMKITPFPACFKAILPELRTSSNTIHSFATISTYFSFQISDLFCSSKVGSISLIQIYSMHPGSFYEQCLFFSMLLSSHQIVLC